MSYVFLGYLKHVLSTLKYSSYPKVLSPPVHYNLKNLSFGNHGVLLTVDSGNYDTTVTVQVHILSSCWLVLV